MIYHHTLIAEPSDESGFPASTMPEPSDESDFPASAMPAHV